MIRFVIQQKHLDCFKDKFVSPRGSVVLTTGPDHEGRPSFVVTDRDSIGSHDVSAEVLGDHLSLMGIPDELCIILDHPVKVTARLWRLGGARGREHAVAEAREITLHASDLVNLEPDDESSDALINLAGVPLEVRDWRGPVSFHWSWADVDRTPPLDVAKVGLLKNKYVVTKGDGSPTDPGAEYFVLRLDKGCDSAAHRAACLAAVHVYALCIRDTMPLLAKDLEEKYVETPHSILCIPYALKSPTEGLMDGEVRFFSEAIGVYRKGEVNEIVTVSPTVVGFDVNGRWAEMVLKKADA